MDKNNMALEKPRLKYCYHAEFLDQEKVLLTSEKDNTLLSSKPYNLVLSELRENRLPLDELVKKLEGKLSKLEIYYVIADLEQKGYLTEDVPALPEETCAYWNNLGIDVNTLLRILQDKTITIESIGGAPLEMFRRAFDAVGIHTGAAGEIVKNGVLNVFITDNFQRAEFKQINREAMRTGQPWMPVKPSGGELWLGPIFLPGKTGCWECLQQRLDLNRQINTFYRVEKKTGGHLPLPAAHTAPSLQVAAGHAAIEIVKWLYFGKNEALEGKIVSIDTQSFTSQSHLLVKRPQCKTCGNPDYKPESHPIVLKRRPSLCEISMAGYREIPAEDTIEKYHHHVSPITGVVQWLKPYYSVKDTPVYNYSSGRNLALQSKTMFWLNEHVRSASGGKGKTWAQAKAGALCEAIERYSLMYHGDEPYIMGSLKELASDGIHPNACMNFSEKQYRERAETNRINSKFYSIVPVPFDESLDMAWTPVYSLTEKKFKYLPSCFCYAQYPAEDELNLFSYPDSNGCAAGNSLEEAILQGFLELVERDSVAIWWYNMLRKPAVALDSFNDLYFNRLIRYYQSLGRGLYVLDLTADLQIPTFGAVSHRLDGEKENIVFGFGAHVDAKIAIERALVELNQLLPLANVPETNGIRGKYRTQDKPFVHWLDNATLENQPYLVPLEKIPQKRAPDYRQLCKPGIYDSLIFCMEKAEELGLETLALDMTRPDVGLNVVRVFLPGLRHFWKRLAPGRLYDVPVKMGWLKGPLKEEELNCAALFI
jgi:ribosomal protein S12 methylthiotransferase accessory factor